MYCVMTGCTGRIFHLGPLFLYVTTSFAGFLCVSVKIVYAIVNNIRIVSVWGYFKWKWQKIWSGWMARESPTDRALLTKYTARKLVWGHGGTRWGFRHQRPVLWPMLFHFICADVRHGDLVAVEGFDHMTTCSVSTCLFKENGH